MEVPCSDDPQMVHLQNRERKRSTGRRKLAQEFAQATGKGEAIKTCKTCAWTCVSISASEGKWSGQVGKAHGNIPLAILGWLDQRFKTDRTQKTSMICRCIIIANMYEWHGAQIQTTHTVLHEFPDGFLRIYFTPFLSFSLSSCWLFCRQWYTTHVHTATWSHRWVCLNTGSNACGVHQFLHSYIRSMSSCIIHAEQDRLALRHLGGGWSPTVHRTVSNNRNIH